MVVLDDNANGNHIYNIIRHTHTHTLKVEQKNRTLPSSLFDRQNICFVSVDRLSSFIYSSNKIHTFDDMMIFNDSTNTHTYIHAHSQNCSVRRDEDRKSLRLYQYLQQKRKRERVSQPTPLSAYKSEYISCIANARTYTQRKKEWERSTLSSSSSSFSSSTPIMVKTTTITTPHHDGDGKGKGKDDFQYGLTSKKNIRTYTTALYIDIYIYVWEGKWPAFSGTLVTYTLQYGRKRIHFVESIQIRAFANRLGRQRC